MVLLEKAVSGRALPSSLLLPSLRPRPARHGFQKQREISLAAACMKSVADGRARRPLTTRPLDGSVR